CLGEHFNDVHAAHHTNLHSHGLHVGPGRNPDGTHSDNVILRLIDPADLEMREAESEHPTCQWLRDPEQTTYLSDDETVGFADYEFRVGNVQAKSRERRGLAPQPHPPGTHWYHPHCHGSTHNQVASGMAGFLIIAGDVDEAINRALTGEPHPDPQLKTGPYDYIERLMLMQRVFVMPNDPDAHTQTLKDGGAANPAVNGDQTPMVIAMRPGAIERWRVLNGSVDGQGYLRVMALKGQYDVEETTGQGGGTVSTLVKLRDAATATFTPATRAEVSADKRHLYQFAFDGVNLIDIEGETPTYTIQDLAEQNGGTESPLDRELTGNPNQAMLANLEACFADAESVKNAFVRPNEVYMAPGNRADLFFQAPRLAAGGGQDGPEIYTVVAREVIEHSDNYQSQLQNGYANDTLPGGLQDIVVAYIVVADGTDEHGAALPAIPDYDVMDLIDVLPEVQEYHLPIENDEVQIKAASGDADADPDAGLPDRTGKYRTRTITYSGWGSGDFPLVTTEGDSETATNFRTFVERDQASGGELELLRYARIDDTDDWVLLAPDARTMAIAGSASTDVIDDMDPLFPITADMGRKFDPSDHRRPQMLESTAEEWAVYNYSISLWADTALQPAGQSGGHYPGQPLLRAEGQARFAAQPEAAKTWRLQTKGVDHPFHIHQNPCWVTRVEVPDENGNLVNILDRPRWQDVVWIPRNGGRVVFRSRFPDYVGLFVNHCHILLHEDHGMMQVLDITPFADQANYEMKDRVTKGDDSPEAVSEIYPRIDQARAWLQSMCFVDPNHDTGQLFPGFAPGSPPNGEVRTGDTIGRPKT
nr:multicopper oxidase domain-containing protein [Chloroflexia bacterium]